MTMGGAVPCFGTKGGFTGLCCRRQVRLFLLQCKKKRNLHERFLAGIPVFLDSMGGKMHNQRLSQDDLEMTRIRAQSRHFSATIGQQVKFKSQTWRKNEAPIKQNKGKSKCLISWKKLVWVVLQHWHL
jgi:hypothetical protein